MSATKLSFLKHILLHSKFSTSSVTYGKNILRRKPIRILNVPTPETSLSAAQETKGMLFKDKQTVVFPRNDVVSTPVIQYEKLQINDPRFTKVLTIVKSRKRREEHDKMLLEGKRLINDALAAGLELQTLYFTREKDLPDIKIKAEHKVELLKVLYRTMQVWSDLTTCPGVMGIFKRPTSEYISSLSEPVLPVTVVCDNIREPGNLGSIIRNAAAVGCKNVILLKGCVDPWDSKVLRTGCGGHYRIPITNNVEWIHLHNYIPRDAKIYIADNTGDIDTSNVGEEYISYDEPPEEYDEPPKYVTLDDDNKPMMVDETLTDPAAIEKYEDVSLATYLYSAIRYPKEDFVVYVGGETHGVDSRIVKLTCEYGGRKVKIPLENGMDSLNSTFALTLILYEIKRQMTQEYVFK